MDFAQQVPVINSGIANIKLGIFLKLSRRYQHILHNEAAIPLAYCVVQKIFLDSLNQSSLEKFERDNRKQVEEELRNAFSDPELKEAISLAYAAYIILLGWQTHNPLNATSSQLIETANNYSFDIPNIVQISGKNAVVLFFQFATDFLNRIMVTQPSFN
jgi:hypothetical protein